MEFFDRLTLDAPRRTGDGYLVASVKVARTGIQTYTGREADPENKHGMRDKAIVRVYRPEDEVFHVDSLRSYAHRPVTNDHPTEAVTAENWKDHSVGQTDGDVMRDGQFVRVSMVVMDAAAIRAVEAGKNQLSQGYTCDLAWEAGQTKDGLEYDAVQRNIRANHTAIVGLARGGSELKIGDSAVTKPVAITLDGVSHTVNLDDAAAILVSQLQTRLTDTAAKLITADASVTKLTSDLGTATGKIAALEQQIKDGVLTPAKLDAAVAERAKVIDTAKKIAPAIVVDGLTDAEVRKAAVKAKLGDAATTMSDDAISGAFSAYAATITGTDTLKDGLRGVQHQTVTDGESKVNDARAAMIAGLQNPAAATATA